MGVNIPCHFRKNFREVYSSSYLTVDEFFVKDFFMKGYEEK